jgi:hypothetical protein
MATDKAQIPACPLCDEPAIDVTFQDFIYNVQCIDCGTFEILELAAKNIQEYSLVDRRKLLARAQRAAAGQNGPPLIREPFVLT